MGILRSFLDGWRQGWSSRQAAKTFEQLGKFIDVELFARCVKLAENRFPGEKTETIAAQIFLYCTGAGDNAASIAASTEAERNRGRAIADEVMGAEGSGFYGMPLETLMTTITKLPDDLSSIKRLALTRDAFAVLYFLGTSVRGSDASGMPIIDRDLLCHKALPLITNAEKYDGGNALLQTTIAQFYNTLNDVPRGMEAAIKATNLDPSNAEAWRLLGNSYMIKDENARARECFETALRLNPKIDGVRQALALL